MNRRRVAGRTEEKSLMCFLYTAQSVMHACVIKFTRTRTHTNTHPHAHLHNVVFVLGMCALYVFIRSNYTITLLLNALLVPTQSENLWRKFDYRGSKSKPILSASSAVIALFVSLRVLVARIKARQIEVNERERPDGLKKRKIIRNITHTHTHTHIHTHTHTYT